MAGAVAPGECLSRTLTESASPGLLKENLVSENTKSNKRKQLSPVQSSRPKSTEFNQTKIKINSV